MCIVERCQWVRGSHRIYLLHFIHILAKINAAAIALFRKELGAVGATDFKQPCQ